ncbi:hypothetical protein ACU4GD_00070 [Cupriavidus basilensis]
MPGRDHHLVCQGAQRFRLLEPLAGYLSGRGGCRLLPVNPALRDLEHLEARALVLEGTPRRRTCSARCCQGALAELPGSPQAIEVARLLAGADALAGLVDIALAGAA